MLARRVLLKMEEKRGLFMKQYVKFLKFLWLLFIVPAVGGMVLNKNLEYGKTVKVTCKKDERSIKSIKKIAVEKSLGLENINPSEINEILGEISCEFKWITNDYVNIMFYEGNTYLSGFLNNPLDNNDFEVRGKKYRIKRLYNVLGVTDEEMNSIYGIYDNFFLLKEAQKWKTTQRFWYKSINQSNETLEEILDVLNEHFDMLKSDEPLELYGISYEPWSLPYLEAIAEYILSSRTLDVDNIKSMKFNEQELLRSVEKAKDKLSELLKNTGNYIKWFCAGDDKDKGKNDGESFLNRLKELNDSEDPLSYLEEAEHLCSDSEYAPYRHTEYITRYLHRHRSDTLFGISIFDMCENCEKLSAKTTPIKNRWFNTVIISLHNYIKRCDSCKNNRKRKRSDEEEYTTDNSSLNFKCKDCEDRRKIVRPKELINDSLLQIQHDFNPYIKKYC